jgi:spermidine synthase
MMMIRAGKETSSVSGAASYVSASKRVKLRHMKLGPRGASAIAFVTAAVTLAAQVLVHRMVSAKLLNNFAFLVISLTMLGFALSGTLLTRKLVSGPLVRERVASWSAGFALSIVAATAILYRAPARMAFSSRLDFVVSLLGFVPQALLLALPFAFCGLILGTLLAAPELPTRRVYGWDLVGSAVGALAVVPAIARVGVEASLLACSAAFLLVSLLVARPRTRLARTWCLAAALVLAGAAAFRERVFALSYPEGTNLAAVARLPQPYGVEHVAWDPVARIEVSRIPAPDPEQMSFPSLVGTNREFLKRLERLLTQNNFAFTFAPRYDGRRESLRGIEETIYASAYQVSSASAPRVFVIGVGGGFDVLTALAFDASDVTAVEINSATVRILEQTYRDYFRAWVADPRVHLVADEGRHRLATRPGAYDVIQLSGVDSYSGTAAAAHVFSENYLYTAEAFDLYLSRLTADGILDMMRLEFVPPREMLRALASAVAALRRAGVARPAEQILMFREKSAHFVALLVKKTPFTRAELERAEAWAAANRYIELAATPGRNAARANPYQTFLELGDARLEGVYLAAIPFDVRPVDDDRPFFFRHSFWWHLFSERPLVRDSLPAMELSVVVLLAVLSLAVLVAVYLPLRLLAAGGLRVPGAPRHALYFAGLGLGYLAIEMALLQKFGLFLGHPNYALSVVLAALLLSTGLGALASVPVVRALGGVRFAAYALSAVILLERSLAFPRLMGLAGLSFAARVAVVALLVAPLGILLGVFFPSGLEALKRQAPEFVPWAWGINAIFSVIAPVVSMAFSMTWGISALLLSAIPVYLATALALPAAEPPPLSP